MKLVGPKIKIATRLPSAHSTRNYFGKSETVCTSHALCIQMLQELQWILHPFNYGCILNWTRPSSHEVCVGFNLNTTCSFSLRMYWYTCRCIDFIVAFKQYFYNKHTVSLRHSYGSVWNIERRVLFRMCLILHNL